MENSKIKPVKKFQVEDLKNWLADLQTVYTAILALTENKNKIAIQVLLDTALEFVTTLDGHIKNCGGVGFTSIDDTLDFIHDLENYK